ncbi:hypothetical protein ACP4OV_028124 [Aristida adscensionis]
MPTVLSVHSCHQQGQCCFFLPRQDRINQRPRLAEAAARLAAAESEREAVVRRRTGLAMAGARWLPLELSLATAGASPSAPAGAGTNERRRGADGGGGQGQRRARQRTVPALYAELAALLGLSSPPVRSPSSSVVLAGGGACAVVLRRRAIEFVWLTRAFLGGDGGALQASQEDVVGAAVERVRVLEDMAAVLEAYRAVRSCGGGGGARRPEVSVVSGGGTACFSVRLPAAAGRPGALTRVLLAFERRGVEVLVATVARHGGAAVVTVTAAAAAPETLEMVRADIAGIQ